MNPAEYQKAAVRTEAPVEGAKARLRSLCVPGGGSTMIRLIHAGMGLSTEANEFLSTLRAWLYYNKPLDREELKDELGDVLWFVALACETMDLDMGEVMRANVRKLLARYPEKFTASAYNNRDEAREKRAMTIIDEGEGVSEPTDEQLKEVKERWGKRAVSGFDPDKPDLGGEEQCP